MDKYILKSKSGGISIEYEEVENISDEKKIEWFQQLNFAGTPQDEDYLNNLIILDTL